MTRRIGKAEVSRKPGPLGGRRLLRHDESKLSTGLSRFRVKWRDTRDRHRRTRAPRTIGGGTVAMSLQKPVARTVTSGISLRLCGAPPQTIDMRRMVRPGGQHLHPGRLSNSAFQGEEASARRLDGPSAPFPPPSGPDIGRTYVNARFGFQELAALADDRWTHGLPALALVPLRRPEQSGPAERPGPGKRHSAGLWSIASAPEIAAGTYDTEDKLAPAEERLLARLAG